MLIFFLRGHFYYFQTYKHLVIIPFFKLCCHWEFSYLHVEFTSVQKLEGDNIWTIVFSLEKRPSFANPIEKLPWQVLLSHWKTSFCKATKLPFLAQKSCRVMKSLKKVFWKSHFLSYFSEVALIREIVQNQIIFIWWYRYTHIDIHFQI